MVAEFTTAKSIYLSAAHQQHIERRGLLNDWARANCRSITAGEASHYLGYTAKSGGILFAGDTLQIQFKPDKPWQSPQSKKAPKYRSPVGEYDAFLPKHPTDQDYWEPANLKKHCWQIDGHPCLPITEGPFKAIAGCANDIPTIALLGVSMGLTGKDADVQGKRYLVPSLEKYARAGIGFIFIFDADAATNPNIIWEQRKLGRQLLKFSVPVYSITGTWDAGIEGETKGMDDFIQRKGIEEFRRMLARSVRFEDWESSLDDGNSSPKFSLKPPAPQELGAQFAEDLRDRLCYSEEHKSWMKYELQHRGVWGAVSDDYLLSAIHGLCKARGTVPNNAYCTNVLGAMKRELYEFQWGERPSNELLPFEDGVLEIDSGQWHEHAPGFRLTWSLPRSYKGSAINAGWAKIDDWIDRATDGSRQKKEILLAFIAACLRGMSNLQKFLMLNGPGGTGKGLYTRLTTMIVGERNTWIGNLEDLTKADKVAELQTKRLAVFDDQEKYTGNLSNFRSLTGGGQISGRKLYQNAVSFRFPGLVLITANQPCFPASGLSWLKRRVVQEEFRHTPVKRNTKLEKELEPELSAFTQYLLSIPVAEIERILGQEGCGINGTFWADRVRADPMASWVNDCLIRDPAAKTAIGGDKDEWKDGDYKAAKSTLFGSYNHYCRRAGYSAKGKNNFSADLAELCHSVLEWKDVAKDRSAAGVALKGLRLRTDADTAIATVEELLAESKNADLDLHDADFDADLKPLPHKGYVDLVDPHPKLSEKIESEILPPISGLNEPTAGSNCCEVDLKKVDPPEVCTVSTNHTEQSIEPPDGQHSGQHSGLHSDGAEVAGESDALPESAEVAGESDALPESAEAAGESDALPESVDEVENGPIAPALNEGEAELVEFARSAIAAGDVELAKQVQNVLSEACNSGGTSRSKVWHGLSPSEQDTFKALLAASSPTEPTGTTSGPIAQPEPEQSASPSQLQSETVSPLDALAMREIASLWWSQYYPEQLQTLLTQMFGWGQPGSKYSPQTIARWLETESEAVRVRIAELMRRRAERPPNLP